MKTLLKVALGVIVLGVAVKVGYDLLADEAIVVETGDAPDEPVVVKDTDGPSVDDIIGTATVVVDEPKAA